MKKKIALFLSVLSVVMMLGACGTQDPTTVDYNGKSYKELHEESVKLGTALAGASVEQVQAEIAELAQYGEEGAIFVDLCNKWLEAMEVSGKYVGYDEESFTITKSGKTLTTDLMLKFEDRDVVFELVYNYHNMEMTGVTINPVYSLGEKMLTAALNTIICMSMVFTVLIFISLIIASFKVFSIIETKKREKAANATVDKASNTVVTQTEQRKEPALADDIELAIVLAAAIEAYEAEEAGKTTSKDKFVARSIRRR